MTLRRFLGSFFRSGRSKANTQYSTTDARLTPIAGRVRDREVPFGPGTTVRDSVDPGTREASYTAAGQALQELKVAKGTSREQGPAGPGVTRTVNHDREILSSPRC
jgi:hypothetical protein